MSSTAPPGVRSATTSAWSATVAWNASHIVAASSARGRVTPAVAVSIYPSPSVARTEKPGVAAILRPAARGVYPLVDNVGALDATLYSISVSHPARAAGLMLAYKGIKTKIVNLPVGSQQVAMRAFGFRGGTVPGLKIDGRRVQGSTEISRALDEAVPEPPLFPADPERRAAVEAAERWGEAVYQPVPRRIFRWAMATNGDLRERLFGMVGTPVPAVSSRVFWPVAQFYVRLEGGGEDTAREDVAALPDHLDHVDALIAAGTLHGEALNAADFQIGTTTRVLLNFPALRHLIAGRPAAEHATRIAPDYGREAPVEVPAEWIPAAAGRG